jgi:membrane protein implicated in regulation of membrane protease activity
LYAFIVGDDGLIAFGVVAALAVTGWTAHSTALPAWWIVAAVILGLLPLSIRKAVRAANAPPSPPPPTT